MSIIQLNNNLIDCFNNNEHSATYTFEHDGSILVPSAFGDLCLRLTKTPEGLYQISVTNHKQLNEIIFLTTELELAEDYIFFIITRKVNPDYLNNFDPQEVLCKTAPPRFLQQGMKKNNKFYNQISWIYQNQRKEVLFKATSYSDLRVHNHLMKYFKYIEDNISKNLLKK